jgi:hypothetical protein
MTKDEYKKYMKGVLNTTKGVTTEAVGYGVAGKIAGSIGSDVATKAFSTGSSLAGMPSLVYGASNVMGAVDDLFKQKKKK